MGLLLQAWRLFVVSTDWVDTSVRDTYIRCRPTCVLFTARCTVVHAKRGIAIACRLSVCLSVRLSVCNVGEL